MGWPKGKPRKPVGSEVRHDAEAAPVQQVWKTDIVEGTDPDFAYQFMRDTEVQDRGRSKRVFNRDTGEYQKVAGWTVVNEGEVDVSRERPDLAKPVDTAMRMGPHVLMKIPKADWELLQHEKDAVADAQADRLLAGQHFEATDESVVRIKQSKYAAHPALMGGLVSGG